MIEQPGKKPQSLCFFHLRQRRGIRKPWVCTAALPQSSYARPWEHSHTCPCLRLSYLPPGRKFPPTWSVLQWKGSCKLGLLACWCRDLQGASTEARWASECAGALQGFLSPCKGG